jgi:cytochrome b pre-mRNA-processing protein 3
MVWFFSRKPKHTDQVFALYNDIVAQSRQPKLFAEWKVPDTVTGRFDMVSLHMALVLRRLRSKDDVQKAFSQALFDLFFKDMDRSLREIGVSDVALPKRIEKMGELFYGLLEALDKALADTSGLSLESVLAKNVFAGQVHDGTRALTCYVKDEVQRLDAVAIEDILAGKLVSAGNAKKTPEVIASL